MVTVCRDAESLPGSEIKGEKGLRNQMLRPFNRLHWETKVLSEMFSLKPRSLHISGGCECASVVWYVKDPQKRWKISDCSVVLERRKDKLLTQHKKQIPGT